SPHLPRPPVPLRCPPRLRAVPGGPAARRVVGRLHASGPRGPAHVYVLVHAGARAGARGRGGATAAGGRGRLGEPARRPGGAAHRSRSSGTRGVVAPARCRGAPRRGGGDRADRSRAGTAPRLAVPDRGGRPAVRATTGAVVGGPVRGRR